jgi:hypothetical protein
VQVCRNDLLNFGRLHFFFPDSRLALDLNTDKTLKEARFDRHFVRDIVWSRHQLQELAERRFRASQEQYGVDPVFMAARGGNNASASGAGAARVPDPNASFSSLFKEVRLSTRCATRCAREQSCGPDACRVGRDALQSLPD